MKCGRDTIDEIRDLKLLGVTFSGNMSFDEHCNNITKQLSRKVGLISRLRHSLDTDVLNRIYKASIEPVFRYCSAVWSYTCNKSLDPLIKLQKKAARLIMFRPPDSPSEPLFEALRWKNLETLWKQNALCVLFRVKAGKISSQVPALREVRSAAIFWTNVITLHFMKTLYFMTESKILIVYLLTLWI